MTRATPDMRGKIALVTGATRGGGRAIAAVLGERGATVYVTGRSIGGTRTEDMPGTVEDAAAEVTARGGQGIGVHCDHTRDDEVAALFARIAEEQDGRLDLLVNNVWGGYEAYEYGAFDAPFWEQPLPQRWDGMFVAGVRAHFVASQHAARLMLPRRRGLIINTIAWDRGLYLGNLVYDVAKAAIARMAFGTATELRPYGIAALALAPGFMRTERVMAAHAAHPFPLDHTESPEYLGRAVAALATDVNVMAKSGQTLAVGDLAREYGFTDIDGTRPPPFRIAP